MKPTKKMECQICMETFAEVYKVNCGSSVDHLICFGCESKWRSKMPLREGKRVMTCPTCRQPEVGRTVKSLEFEVARLIALLEARTDAPFAPLLDQDYLYRMMQQVVQRPGMADVIARVMAQSMSNTMNLVTPQVDPLALAPRAAVARAALARVAVARVAIRGALAREAVARSAPVVQVQVAQVQVAPQVAQVQVAPQVAQAQVQVQDRRPPQGYCTSGRDCRSRSRTYTRTKTHLKCRNCNVAFCCNICRTCMICPV